MVNKNYFLFFLIILLVIVYIGCKKETEKTTATTTSSTSSTAATASTATTAATSSTSATATTASSTSNTSSTSTTSTNSSSSTTTSTSSTTGSSNRDFSWNGSLIGSISISDCSFNSASRELSVNGKVSNTIFEYEILAEFVLDSVSATGNYLTQYSGAPTSGRCVVYIAQTRLSDNFTSNHKSQSFQNVTLTKIAENKFIMSFGTINFGVLPSGTAIRTASVTAFGCP